ncbi:hypothetical protein NXS19_009522 [Fusarium pseudograminearum]|uniref:Uncharacterized protein n=1 Tax=Fusarium pseudograminearum (strain CS3096) TaxID=1028729 RepID=K3VKK8_FUSPC|nr:hypothetical protein FPSE_04516 [Fusarium pseudograminearum CS3096]EKJ75327.1 hypothetical protein FPSE_04516 [Fusarium pseudograminearum CS3096]UZP41706.1 hypothetical protein NXS19_009522 [Fusarium pseudograminearum]
MPLPSESGGSSHELAPSLPLGVGSPEAQSGLEPQHQSSPSDKSTTSDDTDENNKHSKVTENALKRPENDTKPSDNTKTSENAKTSEDTKMSENTERPKHENPGFNDDEMALLLLESHVEACHRVRNRFAKYYQRGS